SAVLAGWVGACLAQSVPPPRCVLTDRACLEANYPRMCNEGEATPESCIGWLRKIRRSPNPGGRGSVAPIYLNLAGFWGAQNPVPRLQERATELIHDVLETDPSNVGALLSLSSIARTDAERVRALRRVVDIDPSPMHLEFLASAL